MIEDFNDTIVAPATASGVSAIAVIRLSGKEAISICNKIFKGKDLSIQPTHTIHFGTIRDGERIIDEVLVSLFKGPKSFTKEDVIEISTHGSPFIVKQILQLLIRNGARSAKPGEFTKRAFLNGQFDLAQAEAVADLIASDSEASHQAAMSQMRGGFSSEIKMLREKLVHFASMIELELDFSEEDVEFADRTQLKNLIFEIRKLIAALIISFDLGNVIKNGVPTVIAGKPNAGKSTLLNTLLNEEKAIVSHIAGTTRDMIEDELSIEGIIFRFIDTAGLRETTDTIESIGVERSRKKILEAALLLYVFDLSEIKKPEDYDDQLAEVKSYGVPFIMVGNKSDHCSDMVWQYLQGNENVILIGAKQKHNIDGLKNKLLEMVNASKISTGGTIVTNIRHYESLLNTRESLDKVLSGIDLNITGDFLAQDIRKALMHLGEITGEITTDDLLGNIFSKFCIGK